VKAFAWILTAAAILIGADVFVLSTDAAQPTDPAAGQQQELAAPAEESEPLMALHGGSGMPPPPPD
jgi:hypothetical protein